ncbi:ATP-binding cassette domain-containing protein [Frankia sp. AgB1.9]|uniref:ABC transporter ATP-binding protein n=1 Tax=unclassified Frankia TaxID=2632575 RepID=UPI001932F7F1|nr:MULTISPECIES: ATP-binding cassette domain-containing protein [unclassified Frankia]MBL7491286.1 ATP-binding cassette domain-containing protein [Frankia sp. AgW1.1]MBL7553078.1 ATP-binding cassette domain-containing protein [Frankia sp. AgB1.9]MBL7623675.1 ATP-binding cassette domain-containing protein [Frankia sp. AgB1.8]
MPTTTAAHPAPSRPPARSPAAFGDAAIRARGLRKAFGDVTVLDGVDLDIAAGSVHALLGANGAGKTTLVRILATLLPADAGTVTVAGRDVRREPRRVREVISLTGQHAAVDELLTGVENLRLAARLFRLPRADARRRVDALIEAFDLAGFGGRLVRTYSGGQRRRLDLAVGLVADPAVIFLDEPTTGLDPRSRQGVWDVVARLADSGATVLLTTQYLQEADELADRISVLHGGQIVAEGSAADLKASLGTERAELTFPDDDAYTRALAHLRGPLPAQRPAAPAPSDATAPAGLDVDRAARRVGVPTDGSAGALRRLLIDLADAGIEVTRVELRNPTLDDVFLTLTSGKDLA